MILDKKGNFVGDFDYEQWEGEISANKTERSEQELAVLNAIGLVATQLLDPEEILHLAIETMVTKLGMTVALIYVRDETSGAYKLRASYGVSQAQIEEIDRRRQSGWDITREVIESGREVFVADMAQDARFHGVWEQLEGRSYVKLPLLSRGTVIGVLGVVTQAGQSISLHTVEFLKAVGREIGIALDNAILLANTREREKQAVTLYKLGTRISASLTLSSVLEAVAQASRELIDADIGLVGLFDPVCEMVEVKSAAGAKGGTLSNSKMAMEVGSPWNRLIQGHPIISGGDGSEISSLHDQDTIAEESITSLLAVPLQRGDRFLGLVEVITRQPRQFLASDAKLLQRLAQRVVVSIENAQLYRQLHNLAALEERDRLARELHDHLAQGLAYLKVKATITDDLLCEGKIDEAKESLEELKKAAQILYTDVREEIFNLRTVVTEPLGFFSTLQEYLNDYSAHYELCVNLSVENETLAGFEPEVASQLLHIIQEALTNVRRHSGARSASIHCRQAGGHLWVNIEDNGKGFIPAEAAKDGGQRYGLQIMQERAESVGGKLELASQPGKGTRIEVRVPVI